MQNSVQLNSQDKHSTTIFAAGLNNPRGLKFAADQFLYVAEGGSGGTNSTAGQCQQVPAPVGPYTGGMTARVSKISKQGERVTVVDMLPSSATSPSSGGSVSGVADIAFAGESLYAILAGGGCSHGNPDSPNGVIKVEPDGSWKYVANLSEFLMNHPVKNPDLEDLEPDGTWYSMIFFEGAFYALDPHNGEIDRISPDGEISRLVDISDSQGHIVPTSITVFDNNFYVGNLSKFPLEQGAARILRITKSGAVSVFKTGFTNILGLLFDTQGRLYVLESNVGVPMPARDKGRLVRVDQRGESEIIVTGLSEPSAMAFGPDGSIYIANKGYNYPPGQGEILHVESGD
jgi:hypothetical protein